MNNIKIAENILRAELFQAFVETTGTAHFVISGESVIYTNQAFKTLTGFSTAEIGEIGVFNIFSEKSGDVDNLKAVLGCDPPHPCFETEITTKGSEKKWVAITFTPIGELSGRTFMGTVNDITVYKRREESLRQSELRYKTAFEMAPDMFVIYNTEGAIIDQNKVTSELFGIPKEEALNKKFVTFSKEGPKAALSEEDKARFPHIREHTLKYGEWRGEMKAVRDMGQGPEFIFFDSHVKVTDIGGEKIVICNAHNTTERKKMEEQIRQALREKETLLREIHHRVKNNMQIISTLLQLQLRNSEDEKTMAMFRESQNRIRSMAMIHEKLYQSEGLHRIDLKDYIDDLAMEVFNSFGEISEGITLKTEVEDIAWGLDTAIPCGLIIIELISNSLKYAFSPNCGKGEIFIGLRSEDTDSFGLTVSDNGVGLPEEVEIHKLRSLGLRLVSDLARFQLNGEMSLFRDKGTTVYVKFKEKEKPFRQYDNG